MHGEFSHWCGPWVPYQTISNRSQSPHKTPIFRRVGSPFTLPMTHMTQSANVDIIFLLKGVCYPRFLPLRYANCAFISHMRRLWKSPPSKGKIVTGSDQKYECLCVIWASRTWKVDLGCFGSEQLYLCPKKTPRPILLIFLWTKKGCFITWLNVPRQANYSYTDLVCQLDKL